MNSAEPSKDEKHKFMREYDAERRKRAKRLFHWSLDMPPEEDTNINVSKSYLDWRPLAVVAATGLGLAWLYRPVPDTPVKDPAPVVQPDQPDYTDTDTRSTIRPR